MTEDERSADDPHGIWAAVQEYFVDEDHEVVDPTTVRVRVEAASGAHDLFVHVRDHDKIVVYATWPGQVPAEHRTEMMELVTRINVELTMSWLELDLDRGVVSARTALHVPSDAVSTGVAEELIGNLAGVAVMTLDRFRPAVEAIAAGEVEVADLASGSDEDVIHLGTVDLD